MNIDKDLKKEGIEVIEKVDNLISNTICKNISRRIIETFPDYEINENDIFNKLSKLTMYKAKMIDGMAEASYFYKNTSIYLNEHIEYEDLEEFAIHECIHYLQEVKNSKNQLIRMGLCNYNRNNPIGLGLNEAAVQYTASRIIGIEPDFEKYYNITLYTPSPSYYPVECSLLNEIIYFTGDDILFKSVLFSKDDFKNEIIKMSSEKIYYKIQSLFDEILKSEENIVKLHNKINLLEDDDSKIDKINAKINKLKNKISSNYISTQNIIIENFFGYEFTQISNLEELESFRRRLYKFSDIIGSIPNYKFFDNYYAETMNKLEHKCNILENGGTETALSSNSNNLFIEFFKKLFKLFYKNKENELN